MVALKLEHVRKTFGDHVAVDDLSLEIPQGSLYGFIGPNGAGKTTTLRIIVDIIRPDQGSVQVLGDSDAASIRQRIGYLPEERGMYKKMRCIDFITYIATLKGVPRLEAVARAGRLMDELDLGKWKTATVDALSKGMQQKLQFASTVVHDPDLLILDEPFSGLDPVNLEMLKTAMLEYRRQGRTVIFSTHMMEHAERLCDSIVMIHRGHKVIDGTMTQVKANAPNRAIRLNYAGDGAFIEELPLVKRVREYGSDMEIFLNEGADSQDLLREFVDRIEIKTFDVSDPSLYDIFLQVAGASHLQHISDSGDLVAEEDR